MSKNFVINYCQHHATSIVEEKQYNGNSITYLLFTKQILLIIISSRQMPPAIFNTSDNPFKGRSSSLRLESIKSYWICFKNELKPIIVYY